MLDKNSETILKIILSDIDEEQSVTAASYVISESLKVMSEKAFKLSIKQLEKESYIKFDTFDTNERCIKPLYKAYCYFEMKRKTFIKSFFTPIMVSIIANLAIALIKWLFPLLKQCLANFR